MWMPDLQSFHTELSHAHSALGQRLSALVVSPSDAGLRVGEEARESQAGERSGSENQPENQAIRAVDTGPNDDRSIRDKPHLISQIRLCENHSYLTLELAGQHLEEVE